MVVVKRVSCGCGAVEAPGRCVLQEEGDVEAPGEAWKTGGGPTWSGMLSIHGSSLMCINAEAACSSPFEL